MVAAIRIEPRLLPGEPRPEAAVMRERLHVVAAKAVVKLVVARARDVQGQEEEVRVCRVGDDACASQQARVYHGCQPEAGVLIAPERALHSFVRDDLWRAPWVPARGQPLDCPRACPALALPQQTLCGGRRGLVVERTWKGAAHGAAKGRPKL